MKNLVVAACLLLCAGAFAQNAVETVDASNARCEAARLKKLEPIRARKIAECRQGAQQPTAGCETYYSTYGNNSNHANGSVVRGEFYDLPECVQARRAARGSLQKQDF